MLLALIYLTLYQFNSLSILYFIYTMNYDPNKSPNSSKIKSLSQQWTNLIKQFKSQSRPKVDLPPIIFQRKSPLENYKNALKLHESLARKKTTTQRVLELSKKKKISTININQDVINKHKRLNSDNLYTLTEQQKQLLNSRQFHKYNLINTNKDNLINPNKDRLVNGNKQKLKNTNNNNNHKNYLVSQISRDKSSQRMKRKQLIRQIKIYHQEHVVRDKARQKKQKHRQSIINSRQSSINRKQNVERSVSLQQSSLSKPEGEFILIDSNAIINTQQPKRHFINNNDYDNQYQYHNHMEQTRQLVENPAQLNDNKGYCDSSQIRNRKLSLQFSKDHKSLKYRYQKDSNQQYNDSIANVLIRNRKQKVQHIFFIFNSPKNHNHHSKNNYTKDNNNHSQSQILFKPTTANNYDYQSRQQQLSQYRQHNNNEHRNSSTQISQRNKTQLITTTRNNSPTKFSIYSPVNKKRQRNYLKRFAFNKKDNNNNKLKLNIKKMEYEPWHDVLTHNDMHHHQSCNIDFTIQNYYDENDSYQQRGEQIQGDDQLPKSKTVIV